MAVLGLHCSGGVEVDPGEVPPALEVVFSHDAGTFTDPFALSPSCPVDSATIRYTLDNSIPDGDSPEYAAPIDIERSTRVRAITEAQHDWILGYLDGWEAALYGDDFDDPVEGYARGSTWTRSCTTTC
jgi:hypothetical protein